MGWKPFDGYAQGKLARGVSTYPPTRWWNHLFLLKFVWKQVTVFQVPKGTRRYRVGYRPFKGPARILEELQDSALFAVRNGHEDCHFFALDPHGSEIKLEAFEISTVKSARERDIPVL